MLGFDLAQTFYVDSTAVKDASTTFVTSVELYFYSKPVLNQTQSGLNKPGVSVYICSTDIENAPILDDVTQEFAGRVEYDDILVDTDDGATSTKFTFRQPIPLTTDRVYAFLVKYDGSDPGFGLWYNKAGENKLGTTIKTQVSSGKVDGFLFNVTNGNVLTPQQDADLTFKLNVARFTSVSSTYKLFNKPMEQMSIATTVGRFQGSEHVFQERADATGSVNVEIGNNIVTGDGTSFTSLFNSGDYIVIRNTAFDAVAPQTNVRKISSIANNTYMVLNEAPSFTNTAAKFIQTAIGTLVAHKSDVDVVFIENVQSNTTLYFANTASLANIQGVHSRVRTTVLEILDYPVNSFIPQLNIKTLPGTSHTTQVNFVNTASYSLTAERARNIQLGERQAITDYPAVVASRSTELTSKAVPFRSNETFVTFETTNPYVSPYVREENLDMQLERAFINSFDTDENTSEGVALAKWVSQSLSLNSLAEDLRVYIRGYRPKGSTIKVYAKLKETTDNQSFSYKDWTEMVNITPDVFSNPSNTRDYKEFEYRIPKLEFTETYYKTDVEGSWTTSSACNQIVYSGSSTANATVSAGDVIRVSSSLVPENYFIDVVTSANSTKVTVSRSILNNSLVGSSFIVEKLDRPNSGFVDPQNYYVYTYFNSNGERFEGYNQGAIKVVLLSDESHIIPYIDDLRAIAVSA